MKHGVFFHFILEGLRGKAANRSNRVTLGSLTEYVGHKVPAFAVRELSRAQRPELLGRYNPSATLAVIPENLPKTRAVTLPGGVKLELVLVPNGTFWMSDGYRKNARKQTTIPHNFYIGKYEITQEQWQAVTGKNPSAFSRRGGQRDRLKGIPDSELKRFPVECVSRKDCDAFLKKLNETNKQEG